MGRGLFEGCCPLSDCLRDSKRRPCGSHGEEVCVAESFEATVALGDFSKGVDGCALVLQAIRASGFIHAAASDA